MKRFLLLTTLTSIVSIALAKGNGADSIETVSLAEIQVYSQPKEQGLLRQRPISSTMLDKRQLEAAQATSLKGISNITPNLFIPDYGSRLTSAIYIRGIGSRSGTPAVGLYVDNIPYHDKSAFDFRFFDIERIDVLRGPQNTLYGHNTMGGLVRIHTRNPFDYQSSEVQLGYTTRTNRRYVAATHYHRVSNRFAFSGGGYYEGTDGFFRNSITHHKVDGSNAGGARMRGIYKSGKAFSLDANLNYEFSKEGAYPYFHNGQITNNLESSYKRGILNFGANAEWSLNKITINSVTGYQNLADRMFMDQDFTQADLYSLEQKQHINTLSEELLFKNKGSKHWQWLTGASITYQWLQTEVPVIFYQDGLTWLASQINTNMPDITAIPALSGMGFKSMSVNMRGERLNLGGTFDTPVLNSAIFHQSTVNITDHFSATMGVRFHYEHTSIDYFTPCSVNYGFRLEHASPMSPMNINLQDLSSAVLYEGNMQHDYTKVLPKVTLKYEFDNKSNIYATATEGMRSGGYNVQMFSELVQGAARAVMMDGVNTGISNYLPSTGMPSSVVGKVIGIMKANMPSFQTPDARQIVFRPEYSWNFEIGTHLNIAEQRLQLDAATFYLRTRDQQIMRFAPSGLGRMMVNAGKSRSFGCELSARSRVTDALTLTATYGYTHAKFRNYDDGSATDYTGNFVPFMPQHSVSADADYRFSIGSLPAHAGISYYGAGRIYWTEDNSASQHYYSLLSARLGLTAGPCDITLWGSNLTNTRYNSFYFLSMSRGYEQHGKPIHFGIDIKVKF